MHTIKLQNPVIAQAAAAMETAIHFDLVDPVEMQSYCIDPIALGFAMIGPYGADLRTSPTAAYMCWDDAHFFASVDREENWIDVYEITANKLCERAGRVDLADLMIPVHRASRQAYKPDLCRLRTVLSDTIFEALEVRQMQRRDIEREMRV